MSTTVPSADAKAVVRAVEALTTQVGRIAKILSTPVVEVAEVKQTTPDDDATAPVACPLCPIFVPLATPDQATAHFRSKHPEQRLTLWPWTMPTPASDGPREQQAPAADEDQALRWTRRESLLVLLTRLQRGRSLTEAEAGTLRHHVETEIREADTARRSAEQAGQRLGRICDMADAWERRLPATIRTATAAEAVRLAAVGDDRPVMFGVQPDAGLHAELEEAQAAIERVRALADRWDAALAPARSQYSGPVRAALDGTEQPTTEAP